jgi:hypothetical protein
MKSKLAGLGEMVMDYIMISPWNSKEGFRKMTNPARIAVIQARCLECSMKNYINHLLYYLLQQDVTKPSSNRVLQCRGQHSFTFMKYPA